MHGVTESEERCQQLKQKIRDLQQRIANHGVFGTATDEILALQRIQNPKKNTEEKSASTKWAVSFGKSSGDRSTTGDTKESIGSRKSSPRSNYEDDNDDIKAIAAAFRKAKKEKNG